MILKETFLIPADRCGVWWVRTFHLYGGFSRKKSYTNNFLKVSVKKTRANNWLVKKTKSVGIVLRTKYRLIKSDSSAIQFKSNNVVLLKKRLTPRGREIFGPAVFELRRKKFLSSLAGII